MVTRSSEVERVCRPFRQLSGTLGEPVVAEAVGSGAVDSMICNIRSVGQLTVAPCRRLMLRSGRLGLMSETHSIQPQSIDLPDTQPAHLWQTCSLLWFITWKSCYSSEISSEFAGSMYVADRRGNPTLR
jgi:hypothetical protein